MDSVALVLAETTFSASFKGRHLGEGTIRLKLQELSRTRPRFLIRIMAAGIVKTPERNTQLIKMALVTYGFLLAIGHNTSHFFFAHHRLWILHKDRVSQNGKLYVLHRRLMLFHSKRVQIYENFCTRQRFLSIINRC